MKKTILVLILLISNVVHASEAKLLSASATSSVPGSASVICLMQAACGTSWSPGSADLGVDEGLYLQFQDVVAVAKVEVEFTNDGEIENQKVEYYVNGQTNRTYVTTQQSSRILELHKEQNSSFSMKSIFIKFRPAGDGAQKASIKAIRFYGKDGTNVDAEPTLLAVTLPKTVKSSVQASSVLEPTSAYGPEHLFDSQYDFAWSTNGKITQGTNETIAVTFAEKQSIAGILIWNGYQRSDEHFKANGRVAMLTVIDDGGESQEIAVADTPGPQKILFSKPFLNVSKLTFKIGKINSGNSYKDVLISEMRFVLSDETILLPEVSAATLVIPDSLKSFVNRSWASFLHQPMTVPSEYDLLAEVCDNTRLRLRDNASFVIYKNFDYGSSSESVSADVLEGSWEIKDGVVRIFGRKYVTSLRDSEYLQEQTSKTPRSSIFQSGLTIKPYSQLTPKEKADLFAMLWVAKKAPANKQQKIGWVLGAKKIPDYFERRSLWGEGQDDLFRKLDVQLLALNPYYVKSSVITDLLLPADEVEECNTSSP